MTKIALIAIVSVQAIKLEKDKEPEADTPDIYTPKILNGWQMEQFEKQKSFAQANPDSVFGGMKVGLYNSRGSATESVNEGDSEPKM